MKELEDHHWFPPVFRTFQMEFIGFVVIAFRVYDGFVNLVNALHLPTQRMTDLCSGSGQPAIAVFNQCSCFSHLRLSDKYPMESGLHSREISYDMQSTDVLTMEFKAGTYYTMFNSFHHFDDKEKLEIVRKIQTSGSSGFMVEILEPTLFCLLKTVFATTIGVVLLSPFILPFSFKRLFFTYVVPVNVFTITFDGIVSVFKSRTADQYKKLFFRSELGASVLEIKGGLTKVIVIHIEPKR